jgi:signal transduction histidine kinase
LPSNFLDSWKIINNDRSTFETFITNKVVKPAQQQAATNATTASASEAKIYQSTKTELESLAATLINSSDMLVTQLGDDSAKNSLNLMLLEIFLGIINIGVVLLILYFVIKVLKPISALTRATSEIKKGNLDVSIEQRHKGNDELSLLGESFNSMVQSIKNYITKQNQLTNELKKLNEQLKHKDQLKDQFINIAAHELRTPIQPILGLSEVIRSHKAASNNIDKGDDEELLDVIIRNAKRLQCLSENILDISKIESQTLKLNKERFNINEKIRHVINDIKSKKDEIEITFAEPKVDPIVVEADKVRIYEVISNLLANAIKFTKKSSSNNRTDTSVGDDDNHGSRSTITVLTAIKSNQAYNKANSMGGGDEVVISIKDRGTGIDPGIYDKLFSIFVTKSDTGSGLGLFISKGIVEAHCGRIWAQNNTDGKGATFSFSLPMQM